MEQKSNSEPQNVDVQRSAVSSTEGLEELREIVASGLRRHDEVGAGEQPYEIKVLLELPLTDPEYQRLRQIVSSSNQ